jgi:endogenous inhibitor of DNA gyrase (YacG/DUF329 family)
MYSKEATRIENSYKAYTELRYTGKCFFCGDEFRSRSIVAKYCSQRCKNDKQIERRAEIVFKRRQALKECIVCSKSIKQNEKGKIKQYCSNKCKQAGYRQRKKTPKLF